MAGSINKVILVGNVGKDPEIRSTQAGDRIANFSLATSETWNDRANGERRERTEWHRVVVFNDHLIPVIEKYVRKGSKIGVEGMIQTRKWTDQSGADRYSTEIVITRFKGELHLLGDPGGGSSHDQGGSDQPRSAPARTASSSHSRHTNAGGGGKNGPQWDAGDLDDEIPF